jgi:hypothetical protein
MRVLALVVAGLSCSGSAPPGVAVSNRASDRSLVVVDAECDEPPATDGVTLVQVVALPDRCVALANEARTAIEKWPGVWLRVDDTWTYRRIDRLAGHEWRGVVDGGGEILGVVDNAVESPGWELAVVATTDGERWVDRGRVRKVYYFATVSGVTMRGGEVDVRVELDDDYGAGVTPGIYHYRSRDGGRSWSESR